LKIWGSHRRELEKIRNAFGGYRTTEQITLHFIASVIPQERLLFRRFDAFGNDGQFEGSAQFRWYFGCLDPSSLPKVSIILNSDHTQPVVVRMFT
jgi:hypothetical protein